MGSFRTFGAWVLLSGALAACSGDLETIEQDRWRLLNPTEVSRIPASRSAEDPSIINIKMVHKLSDGGFVVLDSGDMRIKLLNQDGMVRHHWGGEGSGPGRFRQFTQSHLSPRGVLHVIDIETFRRTTIDTRTGQMGFTTLSEEIRAARRKWPIDINDDDRTLWYTVDQVRDPSHPTGSVWAYQLAVISPDQGDSTVVGTYVNRYMNQKVGVMNGVNWTMSAPFGPTLTGSWDGSQILFSFFSDYEIHALDPEGGGRLSRHIVPEEPVRATRDELIDFWGADRVRRLEARMEFVETKAFILDIIGRDAGGLLWVRRHSQSLADTLLAEGSSYYDLVDLNTNSIRASAILNSARVFATEDTLIYAFSNTLEPHALILTYRIDRAGLSPTERFAGCSR